MAAISGDQLRDEELETLQRLTERYCVVRQTLVGSPDLSVSMQRS